MSAPVQLYSLKEGGPTWSTHPALRLSIQPAMSNQLYQVQAPLI